MPFTSRVLPIALAVSLLSPAIAPAGEVRLAVAANFHAATQALADTFTEKTGHTTRISFGSTGKLYAQIRQGAPFDVFLAADRRRPQLLEESALGVTGSRFTYAQGKLVLWSPNADAFSDPIPFLTSSSPRRLAIANPVTAPYGLAAQQTLEGLDLWQQLGPALVRGESIAQTFQFVATGNARGGFVALAQLQGEHAGGAQWPVPQELYQPIVQQAVRLRRSDSGDHHNESGDLAATAWLDFLRSAKARAIIEQYGYDLPKPAEQPNPRTEHE